MISNVIEVKDFSKSFGDNLVVKDLSFTVAKGEVFGLLGSNGSGKTTTIRALLGLLEPDSGQLLIDGRLFVPGVSRPIGYLPEERGVYKKEKVGHLMQYFAELKGMQPNVARAWVKKYLQQVELSDKINTRVDKLSSGQQQKIQIGLTIINKPRLLILDEPTKGFDPVNRRMLLDIIETERRKGSTIVLITHYMEEAEQLCDRVLLLKDGAAKAYGTVEEVKSVSDQQRIKLSFHGKLPKNNQLYTIIDHAASTAILEPKAKVSSQQILSYLLEQQLELHQFSIERPTLEEIFVSIYGKQATEEINHDA